MSEYQPLIKQSLELRVAIVIPEENSLISPGHQPGLFVSPSDNEHPVSPERQAQQLARERRYNLPGMSAVRLLIPFIDHESDYVIRGYVLRPAAGQKIDLRSFTVSRFPIDELLEISARNPDFIDPVDLHFIRQLDSLHP